MKMTRLKSGWRINITENERVVLNSMITDGSMMFEGDDQQDVTDGMTPAQKAAYTRMLKQAGGRRGLLAVRDSADD